MLDKRNLIKQLEQDVHDTEKKIKYMTLYNVKAYIVRSIIKYGIVLDCLLPYILSGFILFKIYSSVWDAPFVLDEIKTKAKIETIDTSTGYHSEISSFDYEYDNKTTFQHTTAWQVNEYGLFERTITTYRITSSLNQFQIEELLSMSKEEIENIFIITNIEKIQKNILDLEDELYNEEMILIENVRDDENNIRFEKENFGDNVVCTISYLCAEIIAGFILDTLRKYFLKNEIKNTLKEKENNYRPISKKDLEKLKKILEIKKENLELLDESSKNIISDSKQPRILKRV